MARPLGCRCHAGQAQREGPHVDFCPVGGNKEHSHNTILSFSPCPFQQMHPGAKQAPVTAQPITFGTVGGVTAGKKVSDAAPVDDNQQAAIYCIVSSRSQMSLCRRLFLLLPGIVQMIKPMANQ